MAWVYGPIIGIASPPAAGFLLAFLGASAPAVSQCQPTWTTFPLHVPPRRNNVVFNLAVHDEDGPGPLRDALYAMDTCMFFGNLPYRTTRFDGWAWSTVPNLNGGEIPGAHSPNQRVIYGSLSVPHTAPPLLRGLFASGGFDYTDQRRVPSGIIRFDGRQWGGGTFGPSRVAALFDEDGSGPMPVCLFIAGGDIWRWDGRQTSPVGVPDFRGTTIKALCVFDEDAEGPAQPALFVAGGFNRIGTVTAYNIARWDGREWSVLGEMTGVDGDVQALQVFDEDGPGPRRPCLFMGGNIGRTTGANRIDLPGGIARWDGERLSALSPALSGGSIRSMAVFDDDGAGPNRESLFFSGYAVNINGQPEGGIARWDGENVYPLEGGLSGLGRSAETMAVFDEDGAGPNPGGLYVGGPFSNANGMLTSGFARWGCSLTPHCYADCDTSTGRRRIDIFDFLCYQSRYEINDPSACDCDFSTGPRVCDLFDFLCFQNAYVAGCP